MTIFEGLQSFDTGWGCGANGNTQGGGMDYNCINANCIGVMAESGSGTGDGTIIYHVGTTDLRNHQTRFWN